MNIYIYAYTIRPFKLAHNLKLQPFLIQDPLCLHNTLYIRQAVITCGSKCQKQLRFVFVVPAVPRRVLCFQ